MKLKIILSYDGSNFLGSSSQPHKNSVQDELQNALSHLGIFSKVLLASRTDKGVHAFCNVACVECGDYFDDLLYLKKQINKFANPSVNVKNIILANDDFQVRFDVKFREYRYIFNHSRFNPFFAKYCYFYKEFDINLANEILQIFVGNHDFKFFQKNGGNNKSTIRNIYFARAYKYKNLSIFHFRANGFLRAQIRLIVMSVLKVLENKMTKNQVYEQLNLKKIHNRFLAPPNGLYLSKIIY